MKAIGRDLAGVTAWGCVVAGVYGLGGWPWAAIFAGASVLSVYIVGEMFKGGVQ
jgi:hypothetical protein